MLQAVTLADEMPTKLHKSRIFGNLDLPFPKLVRYVRALRHHDEVRAGNLNEEEVVVFLTTSESRVRRRTREVDNCA
jgi:hypothetical protein